MAAERMPDFKEINRLIESLQMLDRSFQRITSEYGEHEANVRKACTAELKKQSEEFQGRNQDQRASKRGV